MKKFALKTLTLIVACMLASTSLVACTDKNDSSSDAKTGDSSTTEGSSVPEQSDTPKGYIKKGFNEETGKYDPPITLTTIAVEKVANSIEYNDVNKSQTDNVWTQEFYDRFGIEVKYNWIVDQTQYDTKYNLMLSSGDIPDFFQVSPSNIGKLLEADILSDLTKAYENAPTTLSKYASMCSDISFEVASKEDKLYGIPHTPPGVSDCMVMYMREDWLKKLNIPEPKTMEDVLEISKAFAQQDPDGNGKADTVGLSVGSDPLSETNMRGFYNGFHAYPTIYVEDENKNLVYGSTMPQMKDALKVLQDLYKEGAISKEFGTEDYNKRQELFTNGKVGVWFGQYWNPLAFLQNTINDDENAVWKTYPIFSIDDKDVKSQAAGGVTGYYVVNKKCEYPDALLMMMDLFAYNFLENTDFDVYSKFINDPKGNEIQYLSPVLTDDNFNRGLKVSDDFIGYFNKTIDINNVTPETRGVIERADLYRKGDISHWEWDFIYSEDGPFPILNTYSEKGLVEYDKMLGSFSDKTLKQMVVANKILQEATTNIIKGKDANSFDEAVEKWRSVGGEEMLKEANEWYAQYK